MTRETVNRSMKKLQQEKIIQRIGADKNGSWKILR
ncbi:helix-turn-helix domain-containing protein [Treponema sp. UBA753]